MPIWSGPLWQRVRYGSDSVPLCDHWDHAERKPRPRAPYLLQGMRHPSPLGIQTIRGRIRTLSVKSGLKSTDGSALVVVPQDCRRVFASEHLNNDTPVHVIQALLGHATADTVMVYAKLYPRKMIEEYRKAVRGLYNAYLGEESHTTPTREEWAAFAASCSMRDMGTYLCALPMGDHCPRGLVCLGCTHAQPKKSAVPIFRRMLASHDRELQAARHRQEPAGQIAARELEILRIGAALRRADELDGDVAAAIEAAADGSTPSAQPPVIEAPAGPNTAISQLKRSVVRNVLAEVLDQNKITASRGHFCKKKPPAVFCHGEARCIPKKVGILGKSGDCGEML
jgi:Phage integrase family